MIELLKKLVFSIYNSKKNPVRDANGKIIDDWSRKRHIARAAKRINSGEVTLSKKVGEGPRRYKVLTKNKISFEGKTNE